MYIFAGSRGNVDADVPMSIVDLIKRYSARQCNNKNPSIWLPCTFCDSANEGNDH